MKKVICAILGIAMMLSVNTTAFATSIPIEDDPLTSKLLNAVDLDITSLSETGHADLSGKIALQDMNGTL